MRPARRTSGIPPSPIRKLVPYAEQARSRGKTVIHLNIGQPDLPLPASIVNSFRSLFPEIPAYTHSAGERTFREVVAQYYQRWNLSLDPEREILTTAGASEALIFTFLALLDPGDHVLIPEPMYANYISFVRMCGGDIIPVPTSIEEGFRLPPPEEWRTWIDKNTRAILLCNPGNPTGTWFSPEEMEAVLKVAEEYDLWLIVDEVYREFLFAPGMKPYSVLTLAQKDPLLESRVVVIDSFSKRMNLCGVRTGMVITRNRELQEILLRMAQARLSPPLSGQLLVQAVLHSYPQWISEVVDAFARRYRVAMEILQGFPDTHVGNPRGAFYTMAKLPVDNAETFCQWLLTDFESDDGQRATIMLAPGNGFYVSPGRGEQEVRIAFVVHEDRLRYALELLRIAIDQYNRIGA